MPKTRLSKRVGFNVSLDTAGHFRHVDSFQTIDCTGTDNQKQGNKTV